jgi:hypothetical protein
MNKLKDHIELTTYVYPFRQQVLEYFNGKHSIQLYPNTIVLYFHQPVKTYEQL